MSKQIKEDGVTTLPFDLVAMKIILEGAEIDYEEDTRSDDIITITLKNGVTMSFGSNQELLDLEVE